MPDLDQPRPMAPVTLVLLPGLDGTEVFLRPLLAALPAWIRPVAVTYPASGPNGYADLFPLVEAAVAGLGDFFILGWSFSGPLALMLAAREPRRARGVILAASFVRSPVPRLTWLRPATIGPVVWALRALRRLPVVLGRPRTDPFRVDKATTWGRVSATVLAARARAALSVDARPHLRACPCRVLYLASSDDEVVGPGNGEEVVRELATARLVTIVGPHLAMYTNPGAAAEAIVSFMAAAESACAPDPLLDGVPVRRDAGGR
jgi:pimeloyl-[acyl-carrier protein] methyl ester esterase